MDQSTTEEDSGNFDPSGGEQECFESESTPVMVFYDSDEPEEHQCDSDDSLTERCEDFFAKRLDNHAKLRSKWTSTDAKHCDGSVTPQAGEQHKYDVVENSQNVVSSQNDFETSMKTLKTEIMSLMDEDDELFKRLLNLNQTIKRMRRLRLQNLDYNSEDPYEETCSPYCVSEDLENATSSPMSTWSSSSQNPSESYGTLEKSKTMIRHNESWDRKFVRGLHRKRHDRRRESAKSDHTSSYDSGTHCSDSEHEIFV